MTALQHSIGYCIPPVVLYPCNAYLPLACVVVQNEYKHCIPCTFPQGQTLRLPVAFFSFSFLLSFLIWQMQCGGIPSCRCFSTPHLSFLS